MVDSGAVDDADAGTIAAKTKATAPKAAGEIAKGTVTEIATATATETEVAVVATAAVVAASNADAPGNALVVNRNPFR